MKKKICSWLDSNIRGGIQILDDRIYPCCGISEPMFAEKDLDYSKITVEDIRAKRNELVEQINAGNACQKCEQIIEKEEEDINVGKISYLSIGLFSTCNLRCKYCYFTHDELSKKLTPQRTQLLPFVKKLAEGGFLKDDVQMGVAGGEPTLFEDLPETLKYLEEHFSKPSVILLSNSSVTARVNKIIEELKDCKLSKTLYTSIDAGTPQTYEKIRGRDLFKNATENIINYAKNNIFDKITLKYILMFDHSNTSDKDIFGFLNFFNKVRKYQKGVIGMTIDCDMLSKEPFDERMIAAAGKLYYVATEIFGVEVTYCGGGLVHTTAQGKERINLVEEYASKYKTLPKSLYEKLMLKRYEICSLISNFNKCFYTYKRICRLIKILYFS